MTSITLLGASGSIGRQTLDVIANHDQQLKLIAFSVNQRIEQIETILNEHHHVKAICVGNQTFISDLSSCYPHIKFFYGDKGLLSLIEIVKADMVVNALVGFVGFHPTLKALESGSDVALANKESLIVGGQLIKKILKTSKAKIYPIDSEHVALSKLLNKQQKKEIKRIILTASGGSLRDYTREQLATVTPDEALNHPTWKMGPRITIDSATMMNKGFEIIEAHYLFNFPLEKIDVVIHPSSQVHGIIEFIDGTYMADIGVNDMRIAITYALFKGQRISVPGITYQIEKAEAMVFKSIDHNRYPALGLAINAVKLNHSMPTVLNASDEEAVKAFLNGKLPFSDIEKVILETMKQHQIIKNPTLEQLISVDVQSRTIANQLIKERYR